MEDLAYKIAVAVPIIMFIGWLIHIAVDWHFDFGAWWHSSDDDI